MLMLGCRTNCRRAEGKEEVCKRLFYLLQSVQLTFRCCDTFQFQLDTFTLKCKNVFDFNRGKKFF